MKESGKTAWRCRSHTLLNACPLPRLPISVPAKTDVCGTERYSAPDRSPRAVLVLCEAFRLIQYGVICGPVVSEGQYKKTSEHGQVSLEKRPVPPF